MTDDQRRLLAALQVAWDEGFTAADNYREDVLYGTAVNVPVNPYEVER